MVWCVWRAFRDRPVSTDAVLQSLANLQSGTQTRAPRDAQMGSRSNVRRIGRIDATQYLAAQPHNTGEGMMDLEHRSEERDERH